MVRSVSNFVSLHSVSSGRPQIDRSDHPTCRLQLRRQSAFHRRGQGICATAIDTDDDTDGGETATFKPNQPASSSSLTTVESGDNAPKKRSSKITVGIPIVSKPVAPSRPLVPQVPVTTNPKSKPAPPKTTTNEPRNVPPSTSSADTQSEQIMKKDRPKPKKKWAG